MFREQSYGLLRKLASGLHGAQVTAFVAVCGALVLCGQARSFVVARQLSGQTGTRFKSGLQRYYRWVGESGIDTARVWEKLAAQLLVAAGRRPVVAVDWTEWHGGKRVLAAGVCLGKRAVPVLARALAIATIQRSQNAFEDAFVRQLQALCPLMKKAVLVFDRGFRRVSLIRDLLLSGQPFVLRLMGKVHVKAQGYAGLLGDYPLRPGQRVDLGVVELRQHRPVRVRIVGVWAPRQKEPWWLATSLTQRVKTVVQCYDRRMTVEEMFRDSKGTRFGMQLFWTRFAKPDQLNRLFLLAAVAVALWTAAGVLALARDPSLRLFSSRRGARRSLVNIGHLETAHLTQLLKSSLRQLRSLLLPTQTRNFAWLT
jgi:hypothetical protein